MHKPPLLAVRASRALRISRASGAVAALAAASTALMVAACSAGHAVTNAAITNAPITTKGLTTSGAVNPTAASLAAAKLATGMPFGAAASPGATIPGCVVGTWAEDFTDAGRLAWQVHLPATPGLGYGAAVQPVATGGLTVFANGDGLYALRLGNGGQVWHRVFGTAKNPALGYVAEVVAWRGSVIALLGAGSTTPELVALNAATGAVRWTAGLGGRPLEIDTFTVTSDGVAVVHTGTQGTALTATDLTTGRKLWSRGYAKFPAVEASGSILVVATVTSGESPKTLTGIQARTGRTLWSRTGFPNWVSIMSAPGGRVLLDGINVLPPPPPKQAAIYPVIALSAATGKTLWQVKTPTLVTAIWPTTAGVAIATGLAGVVLVKDPVARLYLADLKTGKVRWSAAAHTDPYTTPVITATDVITVATTPATGTVVDRAATSGAVKWTAVISDVYGRYLARPAGPNVLVAFPLANQPSRLLALDVATGATRATKVLPATTTVGAPITVDSGDALLEAETASCAPPVHPGPGAAEHP